MLRVLDGEPWTFDKHMMLLQVFDGTEEVRDMKFELANFWVQVHDLPLRFRNRKVAEHLCEAIGTVTRGEENSDKEGGRFVRVRVTVNIQKPLCRGRVVSLDDGKDLWIPFKYERLPNLCFYCGCLTHDDRSCNARNESEVNLTPEKLQYGPWIKAPPFVPSRNKMITVPGIDETRQNTNPPSNQAQNGKSHVVVLRSDLPSPVVVWPDKQVVFSKPTTMLDPDFQQTSSATPVMSQDDKIGGGSVYTSSIVLDDATEEGKIFEVTLESLDKDIALFDGFPESCGEHLNPLGPHNSGPSDNTLLPKPKSPLANLTILSPSCDNPTPKTSPKWTRIKRQVGLSDDLESLNVALGKRTPLLPHSDAKPPKRRTTHVAAQKGNINPTVEAGSQPRREQ